MLHFHFVAHCELFLFRIRMAAADSVLLLSQTYVLEPKSQFYRSFRQKLLLCSKCRSICLTQFWWMIDETAAFVWIVHEAWTQLSDLFSSAWRCLPQSTSSFAPSGGRISPRIYSKNAQDETVMQFVRVRWFRLSPCGGWVWLSLWKPNTTSYMNSYVHLSIHPNMFTVVLISLISM